MSEVATQEYELEYAELETEKLPLKDVSPHPDNPRIHSPEQIAAIQESYRLDGYIAGSMGIQQSRKRLYKGHAVYKALSGIGVLEADFVVKDLTDAETLALLARDNALSDMSNNDPVKLKQISVELQEMEIPIQRMGYTLREIEAMQPHKAVVEDDPPAVSEEEPLTQTGDLWLLGEHRLLVGDSTKTEDVERVIEDVTNIAIFTDPPYGIGVDTSWLTALHIQRGKPACINDDKLQGDDGSLDLSFLWQYDRRMVWGFPYIFDIEATGWIVWDKQPGIEKRGIVSPVEMALTTMRTGFDIVRCMWGGYYKEAGETRENHPTQKPVKVFATFIEEYTDSSDVILDPFLGSGTTLIAADQLDRKCCGIEIAPKYCDVIIQRYINHVGTDEDVYVERDGKRLSWQETQQRKVHVC